MKFFCALLFFVSSVLAYEQPIVFSKRKIKIDKLTIEVEVAETEVQHQHGLMFRKELAPDHGMIFIFKNEETRNFWMKNTFVDLSIGFFNKNKELIDIQEMQSVKTLVEQPKTYQSKGPAQYVLEMPKNWFKKKNIKKGAKFEFL